MRSLRLYVGVALRCGVVVLAGCAQGTVSDPSHCGDGILQLELGEQCDDGNTVSGDGCSANCMWEALGELDCANGLDDDGDGLIDCADPDCKDRLCGPNGRVCVNSSCQCPSGLLQETHCANSLDDDCDGLIDCADPDCATDPACSGTETETNCVNGLDDDGDGLIDCADPDCATDPACSGTETETNCINGLDDDGDGLIDCADPDCSAQPCGAHGLTCQGGACLCPGGATESACSDGLDNDCDGLIDCADSDCNAQPCGPQGLTCQGGACLCPGGTTESACSDGLDNDCDGLIDCADPDCANQTCGPYGLQCQSGACICPGGGVEICGDGIDNDCDGQVDEGCASTCTNPRSPAVECGSATHCMPTTSNGQPGQCVAPAGSGTQYSYCLADSECAPTYLCVDVGGVLPYCLQFCTSSTQCAYTFDECYGFTPSLWVYSQEWGVCWDGLP